MLRGGNGSGKTTLLRLLAGLVRPAPGRVRIDGADTAALSVQQVARSVALAFQEPDLQLFESSVRREVEAGARSPAAAADALRLCGLDGLASAHPHELGYARRKLLSIAAAVAMGTPVVALDEPTLGQDRAGRDRIAGVIRALHEEGRTVILATHDSRLPAGSDSLEFSLSEGRLRR